MSKCKKKTNLDSQESILFRVTVLYKKQNQSTNKFYNVKKYVIKFNPRENSRSSKL